MALTAFPHSTHSIIKLNFADFFILGEREKTQMLIWLCLQSIRDEINQILLG